MIFPLNHDKCIAGQQVARIIECATRSRITAREHTPASRQTAAVAQRRAHRLRPMMKIHEYLVDAVPGHVLGNVTPPAVYPETGSAGLVRSAVNGQSRSP